MAATWAGPGSASCPGVVVGGPARAEPAAVTVAVGRPVGSVEAAGETREMNVAAAVAAFVAAVVVASQRAAFEISGEHSSQTV